jgi:hypothetical protein
MSDSEVSTTSLTGVPNAAAALGWWMQVGLWYCRLPIADCRLVRTNPQQLESIGVVIKSTIGNRQLAIV